MNNIPFLNLKRQYQTIKEEVSAAMQQVIDNTAFAGGPFVAEFEEEYARYCGTSCAIGVNSGTSALHLALLALGIGEKDEVIVPANTFIATAWAISYVGAIPVFVDCDEYWNIDPSGIEEKITERTKAIIGVHLYGQPFNLDEVKKIAVRNNLYLVEDAAQAHGARYEGSRVGGSGELGCFSFYPGKNLGAYGEGGAVVTNNETYRDRIRSLRDHGSRRKYYHDELGFNMRMDGLQAAVLKVKLGFLDGWNQARRSIAGRYDSEIVNPMVSVPRVRNGVEPVYHLYVVTVPGRDDFVEYLRQNGIFPGLHYPVPCHLQKAYSHLGHKAGDFPNSEYLATHCVSLPIFAELMDDEVSHVIETINKYSIK